MEQVPTWTESHTGLKTLTFRRTVYSKGKYADIILYYSPNYTIKEFRKYVMLTLFTYLILKIDQDLTNRSNWLL